MGNSRKFGSNRENNNGNKLVVSEHIPMQEEKKIIVGLMPTGFSVPGYPNAPLTLTWIQENGHDIESLLATGIYYPVYKEELNNGTRTKATTENSIREGDDSERDSSSVLHESESGVRGTSE